MKRGGSPVIIVILILALAAGAFYIFNSSKQSSPQESVVPHPTIPVGSEDALPAFENRYIEYTPEAYGSVLPRKHVLFFYANWCPTCIPADAEFQSRMNEIPEDLVLVRVNYNDDETDSEEELLADQYEITYQHTFVLIENGQVVKKWNGGKMDKLLSEIN